MLNDQRYSIYRSKAYGKVGLARNIGNGLRTYQIKEDMLARIPNYHSNDYNWPEFETKTELADRFKKKRDIRTNALCSSKIIRRRQIH